MKRENIEKQLLGMRDLQQRWHYKTISAVRKRRYFDEKFPKEVAKINGHHLVFLLSEIEEYEKLRPEIIKTHDGRTDRNRRIVFYQTEEEWKAMAEKDRKGRVASYHDSAKND